MLDKCKICGFETEDYCMHSVEDEYGYCRYVCQRCYKNRINSLDPLVILQAKVEGIVESLSDVQRQQAESIANSILAKQAFKDVGE